MSSPIHFCELTDPETLVRGNPEVEDILPFVRAQEIEKVSEVEHIVPMVRSKSGAYRFRKLRYSGRETHRTSS
ncbi:hypothetical protein PGT21_001148 [Puccinia graminis f. sp. tritici]|uniref:Uncharacterized protein n=1 Tax=Puccinia graminis f. sp. tritici TaxID=56615 RepID=A0A5B0P8W6_PUCGR|nr:hypothetical protein PGTUg99_002421 [Puccinia graminis f. sp. tritici]KAA1098915.1 hypothetical protein PGT21_001148 [Puccinia graminis f. sp. tritici]